MNLSAATTGLVPAGVVTVTSTAPAAPAGAVAEIDVAEPTVKLALVVPNFTPVAPVRLAPVMVTGVPPAAGPPAGATPETDGGVVEPPQATTTGVEFAWALAMLALEM